MTFDADGQIHDYGWRVSPLSISGSEGPFGLAVWEAQSMDFSFVGITDYMPVIGTQ